MNLHEDTGCLWSMVTSFHHFQQPGSHRITQKNYLSMTGLTSGKTCLSDLCIHPHMDVFIIYLTWASDLVSIWQTSRVCHASSRDFLSDLFRNELSNQQFCLILSIFIFSLSRCLVFLTDNLNAESTDAKHKAPVQKLAWRKIHPGPPNHQAKCNAR